jgi:multidrug resistance efflux pump
MSANPTVICNPVWLEILDYFATVKIATASINARTAALDAVITNALETPGIVTTAMLTEIHDEQLSIEAELNAIPARQEKLIQLVITATQNYKYTS